jgi:cytochrome c peroxidase
MLLKSPEMRPPKQGLGWVLCPTRVTPNDQVLSLAKPQISSLIADSHGPSSGDYCTGDDIQVLRLDTVYREMFPVAFPSESDPFSISNVTKAIASFERTIISAGSGYDRYHYGGEDQAISDSAKRGEVLFFSEPLSCFRCHGGVNFSVATEFEGRSRGEVQFHNTGLYNVAGALSYPLPNVGRYEYTLRSEDVGKFKAPTLRNVPLTAPYMHDGSAKTFDEVLDHYSAGGRTILGSPYAGEGLHNPNKDPLIRGFKLSPPQDRTDLIAFLESLTDEEVVHDQRFGNPWKITK